MRGKLLLILNKVVTARRPECPFNIAASWASPEREKKMCQKFADWQQYREEKRFAKRVEERAR
jgi:hypothetical protein